MTVTTSTPRIPARVQLYPHDPASFLPLLRAHLPHSITTYSTIQTNPWPRMEIPAGVSLPSSSSSSADDNEDSDDDAVDGRQSKGKGASPVQMPDSLIYGAVWATFPASEIHHPPDVWAMLIHLPPPQTNQTRLYCSLDRELLVAPGPEGAAGRTSTEGATEDTAGATAQSGSERKQSGDGGLNTVQKGSKRWREGQDLMLGLCQTVVGSFPPGVKYIPLNTIWIDEVVDWLKDVGVGTVVNAVYDVWLAPEGDAVGRIGGVGADADGIASGQGQGGSEVDKEGLEAWPCRVEDCEEVQRTRDIKEDIEYYIARKDHISVIRRSDTGQPVTWIMTHAAGDLGALYTIPEYRRRGLAKWVVQERLKAGKRVHHQVEGGAADEVDGVGEVDEALRGHVWVTWENVGSRRLWESMGWVRGWSARWVYVK